MVSCGKKGKALTSPLPGDLRHQTFDLGSNCLSSHTTRASSLLVYDASLFLAQNFLGGDPDWHSHWAAVLQPLAKISMTSETIWVRKHWFPYYLLQEQKVVKQRNTGLNSRNALSLNASTTVRLLQINNPNCIPLQRSHQLKDSCERVWTTV